MTLQKLSAYGKGFQIKVLGALLTQKDFLINVRDTLKSEYFDTDTHKWVVDKVLKYFDKYNTTITMDVLKAELQKVDKSAKQIIKVAETIKIETTQFSRSHYPLREQSQVKTSNIRRRQPQHQKSCV